MRVESVYHATIREIVVIFLVIYTVPRVSMHVSRICNQEEYEYQEIIHIKYRGHDYYSMTHYFEVSPVLLGCITDLFNVDSFLIYPRVVYIFYGYCG